MGFQGRGGVFAPLPETMKARRLSWFASCFSPGAAALKPALILFAVVLAVSCAAAPVAWERPGGTQDQWNQDKAACRYNARREAEKRFRQRDGEASMPGFGTTDTLSRDMARFDAKRDERRLFEDCLKTRGYTKKKAAPPKK